MSFPQIGYLGIGWAVILASTVTENVGIAVGIVTILVLLSTLFMRMNNVIEKIAKDVIHEMQSDGDLPTMLEREETAKALASLIEYNRQNE